MYKIVVLTVSMLLIMCSSNAVVDESTLTLFKGGMFSPAGDAVYLFKQKIKYQETRYVSLGMFDSYSDTEYVESSSIVEFDRSGAQVAERVIKENLPPVRLVSFNDECMLMIESIFDARRLFLLKASDGAVLGKITIDSPFDVRLSPDGKSLIYLNYANALVLLSSFRISDGQTTPLDAMALFSNEYGWYEGTVVNRISNDGSVTLWNKQNVAFFDISASRTTRCSVNDSIRTVVNCSSNTWYIGRDTSGIFTLQGSTLQRVTALPYIDQLVCTDSAGVAGLVKDSTLDASTAHYLPGYKIVDLANPEKGIEIGRSCSE